MDTSKIPSDGPPSSSPAKEVSALSAKEIKHRDHLLSQIAALEAELANLKSKNSASTAKLTNPAKSTIQRHIKLLHDFNEIRDVGLHLIGMIADERGVGLKEVLGEFGVTDKD
ncbi:hypothetical protein H072_6946 [Dactylellina haptotyla CBS 200.50]|uniref:Swi5-domain-containing protein n=1 Tax=Dactylellina haptotyla (strain CBS 200.50) TaxID=1284197 RepID=S8A921_DACHA|nr:hypothetical protein H072_6946 [Dactylellina haptotyla CBS 200.50]